MRLVHFLKEAGCLLDVRMEVVLMWALVHDLDETISGDLPTPVKRGLADGYVIADHLGKAFPWYDAMVRGMNLAKDEVSIVKVADYLEAILFAHEDMSMGNGNIQGHIDYISNKLDGIIRERFTLKEQEVINKFINDSITDALEPVMVVK